MTPKEVIAIEGKPTSSTADRFSYIVKIDNLWTLMALDFGMGNSVAPLSENFQGSVAVSYESKALQRAFERKARKAQKDLF